MCFTQIGKANSTQIRYILTLACKKLDINMVVSVWEPSLKKVNLTKGSKNPVFFGWIKTTV